MGRYQGEPKITNISCRRPTPPTQLSATISPNLTPFVDELKNQAWRQVNGVDSILTEPHPNFATIKVWFASRTLRKRLLSVHSYKPALASRPATLTHSTCEAAAQSAARCIMRSLGVWTGNVTFSQRGACQIGKIKADTRRIEPPDDLGVAKLNCSNLYWNRAALKAAKITMDDLMHHIIFNLEFLYTHIEPSDAAKTITVIDLAGAQLNHYEVTESKI